MRDLHFNLINYASPANADMPHIRKTTSALPLA